MKWNLRVQAAERGIWKSAELRRMLADAGLEISVGKMSGLWTGTPTTIRLDDLDVICHVLDCSPTDVLVTEPEKIAARKPGAKQQEANGNSNFVSPRFGPKHDRPAPPL